MRRCGLFLAVVVVFAALSTDPVEADYILAKFDMSLIYQNAPNMPALAPPPPPPMPRPQPQPGKGGKGVPMPPPMPFRPPQAVKEIQKVPPGTGPFIYSIIEVTKWNKTKIVVDPEQRGQAIQFDHPYGRLAKYLEMANWIPNVDKYTLIIHDSPAKKFEKEFKNDLLTSKDPNKFLEAAASALKHGLKDEFHATMGELVKLAPKRSEVVNYLRVRKGLSETPRSDDPYFAALYSDLAGKNGFRKDAKGHYVVLTDLPQGTFDSAIHDRVRVLETTLENYYYWFALQPSLQKIELQPPLPRHRLGLVILKSAEDFYAKHAEWGAPPFGGDAFTPRRDNFIVSSFSHLDEIFKKYERSNQKARDDMIAAGMSVNKQGYLSGTVWESSNDIYDQFRRAYCQTLTITEKLIDDDQIRATHTGEGARQLLFDSGVLPRHVHTPEWIAQGMSAFFETSTGAPYLEVGAPNWRQVVNLKVLKQQGKLDKPGEVLRAVVTDKYFRVAHRTFADLNNVNDKAKINLRMRDEYDLARSTAWALVYYLIERQRTPEKLMEYCRELDSLPRDLDLDERALEACFAKAFKLGETQNPLRLDPVKLNAFADEIFREMAGVSLEIPELQNEYFENRRSGKATNSMN